MSSSIKTLITFIPLLLLSVLSIANTTASTTSVSIKHLDTTTATNTYQKRKVLSDSVTFFKEQSLQFSKKHNAKEACKYLLKYIENTGDLDFIKQREFKNIKDTDSYVKLTKRFIPKTNIWIIFFLFSSAIGLFFAIVLNIKRGINKTNNLLISLYILFNSLLIAHITLYFSNLHFTYPHSYYATISFSYLYGPLLYFYFRRVTEVYQFKVTDLLHLIPTLLLIIYIFPVYTLPAKEKLLLLINQANYSLIGRDIIILTKTLSLVTYTYLTYKSYKKNTVSPKVRNDKQFVKWQKEIIILNTIYVVTYIIYTLPVLKIIPFISNLNLNYTSHLQVVAMCAIVLYISSIAYFNPSIFKKAIDFLEAEELHINNYDSNKYQKSGLTPDLSLELKKNLNKLLLQDKIFKQNNLTLDQLAQELETTRHNTSQIINEHFSMNFYELVNQHRITEAKSMLRKDKKRDLSMIAIAYEVGYNNKVTFNKAFKRRTSLTPTQYQEFSQKENSFNDKPTNNSSIIAEVSNQNESNLFSGCGGD